MNENILIGIAFVIATYLLGSIPTAVWVGKWFFRTDVREYGSKNAGATNTIRVLGWKAGIPVLIFDIFKGWLAVFSVRLFPDVVIFPENPDLFRIILAASVVLGHVFPVFAGFRGGKGMATLVGVGIALYPLAVLVSSIIFFTTLAITRYVSLSSITASVSFPFLVFLFFNPHSTPLLLLSILIGIFIPITHRRNIQRLLRNEESKLTVRKKSE